MFQRLFSILLALLAVSLPVFGLEYDVEVKLFLDPDQVLTKDHALHGKVIAAFAVDETVEMRVQFMDSKKLDLNAEGWNVRIRKKKAGKKFEITYKKRYAIATTIPAAVQKAAGDGFDSSKYEAQVEWGYQKKSLSLSHVKEEKLEEYGGMTMPDLGDSQEMAVANIAGKLDKWLYPGWGTLTLQNAHRYGPVNATRYKGSWEGTDVNIEVWQIRNVSGNGYDYPVEISFKTTDADNAAHQQQRLIQALKQQGWFLPKDELKTQMILERY